MQDGTISCIEVEGAINQQYYVKSSSLEDSYRITPKIHILSPFDNLTIQRNRLKDFFQFDYQIECYVPEPKRKYGYFCLPVLYGDQFVGRLDAKANRKEQTLIVRSLHFEGNKYSKIDPHKYSQGLKEFVDFNECNRIILEKSNDLLFLDAIKSSLTGVME